VTGMGRLEGRRIVLTGASSGIGYATTERLAREGATLALIARGPVALEQVAELARGHGATVFTFPTDLADRAAVAETVERAVEALGGLDVVISNAGAVAFGHFLEVEAEDFDRAVAVTFLGAANLIRASLPHLRASRGTLVVTSSLMARIPLPAFSSYAAAKHGLRGLLTTIAVEEREQGTGVRIAMVSPGPVDTPVYRRATSATGRRPAGLPDAYEPDVLAEALVDAVLKPRPEHLVGGLTKLGGLAYDLARPLTLPLLIFIDRWYRTGTEPSVGPGALWTGLDAAREGDGYPSRRSGEVVKLARHGAAALRRAWRLRATLSKPVPEVTPPPPGRAPREHGTDA
jgi:NAD(P)-dependent dehydrogenase (short-subunit alcohol dehydrogenase family)